MKGTTLLTISDERSFGVQANRAVVRPAGSVSAKMWSLGESALESTRCRLDRSRRAPISASTLSSMNFTDRASGAASVDAAEL